MSYNIIIKFLYTIIAIIIGTFICFQYIKTNYNKLVDYNSYDGKTTANIVTDKCLFDLPENSHIVDLKCYYIQYTVDGVKYLKPNQSKILFTNKQVNIIYKKNNPEIFIVDDKSNINNFIIFFISIFILILLWIFLLIIIIIKNNYIHLFYAFLLTMYISFKCIMNIYYAYYYIIGNYIDYDSYINGIVKDKDTIEYSINNVNKTLKFSSFYDFKIGDKVNLLYNKDNIEDIIIYDAKSKIKDLVILILLIISLIIIWFFLIFNISYILN
jgi:hypothetical protein